MKSTCQRASTTECSAFLRSARNGWVEFYLLGAELRLSASQNGELSLLVTMSDFFVIVVYWPCTHSVTQCEDLAMNPRGHSGLKLV